MLCVGCNTGAFKKQLAAVCSELAEEEQQQKMSINLERRLVWPSHVQRLCPRYGGPGLKSRPGALRRVSLPLSLILFPVYPSCSIDNKADKRQQLGRRRGPRTGLVRRQDHPSQNRDAMTFIAM